MTAERKDYCEECKRDTVSVVVKNKRCKTVRVWCYECMTLKRDATADDIKWLRTIISDS